MEANKIKGAAKSLFLDTGTELTYCEMGKENEEVLFTNAFYFHTFMPMVEGFSKRYHVYAIVMRMDGPAEELNPDGSINWARQWGKDLYDFAVKMGISKFVYVGKCHGTIPGWYMIKEHPEMIESMGSLFLAPHYIIEHGNRWTEVLTSPDRSRFVNMAMRNGETGLPIKLAEMATLGKDAEISIAAAKYAGFPEYIWKDREELKSMLENIQIPVLYLFGTLDPLFQDYFESNLFSIQHTRGARAVFLQGEYHLMEIDCPERIVDEYFQFVDAYKAGFFKEVLSVPFRAL